MHSAIFFKVSVRSYSIFKRNRTITCECGLTRKQHRPPIMTPYPKAGEVIYIYSYKSWLRCWKCMAPAFLLSSGGFWLLQSRASEVPDSEFSQYILRRAHILASAWGFPVYWPLMDTELCTWDFYGKLDTILRLLNHHKSQQCVSLQTPGAYPLIRVYTERQHTMLTTPTPRIYHPRPSYAGILGYILENRSAFPGWFDISQAKSAVTYFGNN